MATTYESTPIPAVTLTRVYGSEPYERESLKITCRDLLDYLERYDNGKRGGCWVDMDDRCGELGRISGSDAGGLVSALCELDVIRRYEDELYYTGFKYAEFRRAIEGMETGHVASPTEYDHLNLQLS